MNLSFNGNWIEASRIAVDLGLVVLIWLVQLIIYPSFRHIESAVFQDWHSEYTGLITMVVGPLMLMQVALVGLQLLQDMTNPLLWLTTVLIVAVWWSTAFVSVPIHGELQSNGYNLDTINDLVSTNWRRTIIWSVVFCLGVLRVLLQSSPTDL